MKRGQAALEFLTTYGWAFLVILVMIGALAYFGVLDPTRFMPQRCRFGQEMFCERFALQDDTNPAGNGADRVSFELRNNMPESILIDDIMWAPDDDPTGWLPCETAAATEGLVANADDIPANHLPINVNAADGNTAASNPTAVYQLNRNNNEVFVCDLALVTATGTLEMGAKERVHLRVEYVLGDTWSENYKQYIFGEVFANVN